MNQPQKLVPFNYLTQDDKKQPVYAFKEEDGSVWFVAKYVCEVLGLTDVYKSCEKLEPEEKLVRKLFVSGQNRDVLLVSESGLYTLIFRSNKSEAKRFRKWVTSEVLPALRKTGKYEMSQTINLFDFLGAAMNAKQTEDKKSEEKDPLYAMMNLDRCPVGTSKRYKMYRVKTAIATIEAPATATGEKFILQMLDELNIR